MKRRHLFVVRYRFLLLNASDFPNIAKANLVQIQV